MVEEQTTMIMKDNIGVDEITTQIAKYVVFNEYYYVRLFYILSHVSDSRNI